MSHSLGTLVRDLRLRRGRERRGLTLVEGVRLVEEALAAGVTIRHVLASPALEATGRGRALKAALEGAGHRVESLASTALAGVWLVRNCTDDAVAVLPFARLAMLSPRCAGNDTTCW